MAAPSPYRILEIGLAFFASKTFLSAVGMQLFTVLGDKAMTGAELQKALGLHDRANPDFFDALLAMGFLEREGDGPTARYRNTPDTAYFLIRGSEAYMGGIFEYSDQRLYKAWGDLSEGLRTGKATNEVKLSTSKGAFNELYKDPQRTEQFVEGMAGSLVHNAHALAEKYEFGRYKTMCDIGGSSGVLAIAVARRHPHLKIITTDLPQVIPHAQRKVDKAGLADRITVHAVDFLKDDFPKVDVITMSQVLHDWNLKHKTQLIKAAYEALPTGGAFISVETLIDDDRRKNMFGLLTSLNALVETGDGFDYTGADFAKWTKEAGFRRTEILPLIGPTSAIIAYK
jgi:2-polyprenyl-3-methyl-5-hydroxy-6-metoxy-1,4-benzoquinol methylase